MRPPASILFPTRRRREYLAVALASVAPQAAELGAEIVVVEDDPGDPETEALVRRHGGRYLAHGAARGINVARNTAIDAARGELLCLLDDDVEVWPGWLGTLLAAAREHPGHDAFGGPIRPRLEGSRLRSCGREPLPITSLDLGPQDRDAEFAWGANLAIRRSALERIGRFDPALGGAGDEEDWQRRLRAAGGRIRYVAGAGVDHRRAGADARVRALSRAAFHRGRAARRYDAYKGAAPPLAAELRTLAGCVWHVGRRACGTGVVLTALTAGRLREALAPGPVPPAPGTPDYASGRSGTLSRTTAASGAVRDLAAAARGLPRRAALRRAARRAPRRRVLVLGVARPEHARSVARIRRELRRSRHDVVAHLEPPRPDAGKWANLNALLAAHPADGFDWLLLVDDDVRLPRGFLDAFLLCAERFGLRLAQPAHAFASHAAWEVTRRRPGLLARTGRFVEIGPVTALHRDAFAALLPFPDLRMGWGLDARWSALAAERGLPVGIVDATPVRHLRAVAGAYPRDAAMAEAEAFLDGRAYVTREQAGETLAEHRGALMRVAIVAEYYPRASDPVLGVWAHRQALAARDAGADVRVLVLHRPVPARAALARRDPAELLAPLRQPLRTALDGVEVRYVPFLAPPRPRSYGRWGAWAAPPLALALRRLRREFPYDLVHAHYAAPGGDAVRRARPGTPYVVSVHGGDVLSVARRADGERPVRAALAGARLVLANSRAIERRAVELGARAARVVHLGADLPAERASADGATALVTVAHLVARKRHADVLRALWLLRDSHPTLAWIVVGDGPERPALERLAAELGLSGRLHFTGRLPHAEAVATAARAAAFVLPSVDEAFGVAYVEAMAAGVPAIGSRGEPGPEEIAAAGGGIRLVPPGDPEALAAELRTLLGDPGWRRELGRAARANVEGSFTWARCGEATVAAYEEALR